MIKNLLSKEPVLIATAVIELIIVVVEVISTSPFNWADVTTAVLVALIGGATRQSVYSPNTNRQLQDLAYLRGQAAGREANRLESKP